jgi:hypothetical protein
MGSFKAPPAVDIAFRDSINAAAELSRGSLQPVRKTGRL